MRTRGRLILGVFVIVWMNATLQPCLMAMDLSPAETAPTSISPQHAGHDGHSAHKAEHQMPACAHCPPSMSHDDNSCSVTVMADCDIVMDAKKGERILKSELSDPYADVLSDYRYCDPPHASPAVASVPPDSIRPTFLVGPSLNIQNCVFLK